MTLVEYDYKIWLQVLEQLLPFAIKAIVGSCVFRANEPALVCIFTGKFSGVKNSLWRMYNGHDSIAKTVVSLCVILWIMLSGFQVTIAERWIKHEELMTYSDLRPVLASNSTANWFGKDVRALKNTEACQIFWTIPSNRYDDDGSVLSPECYPEKRLQLEPVTKLNELGSDFISVNYTLLESGQTTLGLSGAIYNVNEGYVSRYLRAADASAELYQYALPVNRSAMKYDYTALSIEAGGQEGHNYRSHKVSVLNAVYGERNRSERVTSGNGTACLVSSQNDNRNAVIRKADSFSSRWHTRPGSPVELAVVGDYMVTKARVSLETDASFMQGSVDAIQITIDYVGKEDFFERRVIRWQDDSLRVKDKHKRFAERTAPSTLVAYVSSGMHSDDWVHNDEVEMETWMSVYRPVRSINFGANSVKYINVGRKRIETGFPLWKLLLSFAVPISTLLVGWALMLVTPAAAVAHPLDAIYTSTLYMQEDDCIGSQRVWYGTLFGPDRWTQSAVRYVFETSGSVAKTVKHPVHATLSIDGNYFVPYTLNGEVANTRCVTTYTHRVKDFGRLIREAKSTSAADAEIVDNARSEVLTMTQKLEDLRRGVAELDSLITKLSAHYNLARSHTGSPSVAHVCEVLSQVSGSQRGIDRTCTPGKRKQNVASKKAAARASVTANNLVKDISNKMYAEVLQGRTKLISAIDELSSDDDYEVSGRVAGDEVVHKNAAKKLMREWRDKTVKQDTSGTVDLKQSKSDIERKQADRVQGRGCTSGKTHVPQIAHGGERKFSIQEQLSSPETNVTATGKNQHPQTRRLAGSEAIDRNRPLSKYAPSEPSPVILKKSHKNTKHVIIDTKSSQNNVAYSVWLAGEAERRSRFLKMVETYKTEEGRRKEIDAPETDWCEIEVNEMILPAGKVQHESVLVLLF